MKKVRYWIVCPSVRLIERVYSDDYVVAKRMLDEYKRGDECLNPCRDATICTNECPTTFANGLVFSNGKFLEG